MTKILKRKLRLKPDVSLDQVKKIISAHIPDLSVHENLLKKLSDVTGLSLEELTSYIDLKDIYSSNIFLKKDESIAVVYSIDGDILDLAIFFEGYASDMAMEIFLELKELSQEVIPSFYHQYYPIILQEGEPYEPTRERLPSLPF